MRNRYHLGLLADRAVERLGTFDSLLYEGTWYRNAELAARADRLAAGLRRVGVSPGDRVVVLMANGPEVGISYSAIWRAGAVVTPVVFLVSVEELRHILTDSGAVAVLVSPELLPTLTATGVVVTTILAGGAAPAEPAVAGLPLTLAELEDDDPGGVTDRDADDLAALLYTGGTTGRAKGVMLTHAGLYRTGEAARRISEVPGLTSTLVPLPLSHAYGLIVTIAGLHSVEPGFAVLQRWFDPAGWVALVQAHRITTSSLVPSMVAMLLAQPLEEADLSSLRFVTSGAAPLAPRLREEFQRRIPSVRIGEGYGCTESSAVISSSPYTEIRPGTVGRPLAGVEVRIRAEDGTDLPPGDDGEICVRSPGVMLGYWHAERATAETVVDGWLATGDIGHLDVDGYLSIVDRKKDLIIRGGFNIYPRDIEDVLLTHPDVAAAAVVGRPDDRVGEEVVGFVSLRPGASVTVAQLLDFGRERLARHKYPREIRIVPAVPLTSVGKTDRKEVRRLLRDGPLGLDAS